MALTVKSSIIKSSDSMKKYFGYLCNNEELSDIYFVLKNDNKDEKQHRIPGHKLVLSVRSDVFKSMFFGSLATNTAEIEIPDVDPTAFMVLLNFLYCNDILISSETVMNILYVAKKYIVPELENHCVEFLEKELAVDNAFFILNAARLYDEPKLAALCLDMIDKNTTEILDSDGFTDIDLKTLISVLERDTLQAFESKLFQAIILWSEAECGRKQLTVTPDNQRHVLGRALTLIHFSFMTMKEFEKGPIQSGLLDDSYIKRVLMDIGSITNSTERPRCSKDPLEVYLKFYHGETKTIPVLLGAKTSPRWFQFFKPVFIVGFVVLNISKNESNVELALALYNPFNIIKQNIKSSSSSDQLVFMLNKPIMLTGNENCWCCVNITCNEFADPRNNIHTGRTCRCKCGWCM
ncbi:BTB/POZ domain-containing protein 2-like isoform X2 [Chrysoperla carnea]|uniref:BTB/POZ domain-containing protein 2-like isoform X2 n=1 Tax=Chrysoperla carnea TaxID=189513 RepID=UPI001D07E417|nr:BTB/POZ domain-containing protein 2-like isoform X2 [Chrysoperla carnea]